MKIGDWAAVCLPCYKNGPHYDPNPYAYGYEMGNGRVVSFDAETVVVCLSESIKTSFGGDTIHSRKLPYFAETADVFIGEDRVYRCMEMVNAKNLKNGR